MAFLVVYVTHPDEETARQIANQILHERLVACVNLHAIHSQYWWQDKIEEAGEWVTLFKTRMLMAEKLEKRLLELHPYEVPCIVRWEVTANADYEEWIIRETE